METPVPLTTPYDILPPSVPAWVPSLTIWGVVCASVLVGALVAFVKTKSPKRPPLDLFAILHRDLSAAKFALSSRAISHDTTFIAAIVSVAVRVGEYVCQCDLASSSPAELMAISARQPSTARGARCMSFLQSLARCKEELYRPITSANSERAQLFSALVSEADELLQLVAEEKVGEK